MMTRYLLMSLLVVSCKPEVAPSRTGGSDSASLPVTLDAADATVAATDVTIDAAVVAALDATTVISGPRLPPEQQARLILQQQLVVLRKADWPSFEATFAEDATIIGPEKADPPEGVDIRSISHPRMKIDKLVVESTDDAVWFYAEVDPHMRVAELLVASESWRAVAAAFIRSADLLASGDNIEIWGANTANGALARLATSPAEVAAHLAPNAIVIGPSKKQFARGSAAKGALESWKLSPMTLFGRAREVTTPTWGFVQANVDHPSAQGGDLVDHITVQLFAIPTPDKTWSVVLALYTFF